MMDAPQVKLKPRASLFLGVEGHYSMFGPCLVKDPRSDRHLKIKWSHADRLYIDSNLRAIKEPNPTHCLLVSVKLMGVLLTLFLLICFCFWGFRASCGDPKKSALIKSAACLAHTYCMESKTQRPGKSCEPVPMPR